jgi:hypothetical protein
MLIFFSTTSSHTETHTSTTFLKTDFGNLKKFSENQIFQNPFLSRFLNCIKTCKTAVIVIELSNHTISFTMTLPAMLCSLNINVFLHYFNLYSIQPTEIVNIYNIFAKQIQHFRGVQRVKTHDKH